MYYIPKWKIFYLVFMVFHDFSSRQLQYFKQNRNCSQSTKQTRDLFPLKNSSSMLIGLVLLMLFVHHSLGNQEILDVPILLVNLILLCPLVYQAIIIIFFLHITITISIIYLYKNLITVNFLLSHLGLNSIIWAA